MNKAAKEDYDMVAFPSGDIQFDRWRNEGLKQQYDEILPGIIKLSQARSLTLELKLAKGQNFMKFLQSALMTKLASRLSGRDRFLPRRCSVLAQELLPLVAQHY